MKSARPFPTPYSPERNGLCLCGSGKKFKRCCMPHLPRIVLGVSTSAATAAENYSDAIVECRADITQYTIWHKSHTEPFVRDAPEPAHAILEIDIKALSELVDTLLHCYAKTQHAPDIPEVLQRLRANIHDPRWQRKVTYFLALDAYLLRRDPGLAKAELKKLGPILEETDSETLQLYLDLFGSGLSFSNMQDLIDRILRFTKSDTERLHYRSLKAVQYVGIGDNAKAQVELDGAISAFRASADSQKMGAYAMDVLASALGLSGSLRGEPQLLDEAITLYQQALRLDTWTLSGRAKIFRQLGETLRQKGAWALALNAYAGAAQCNPHPIINVFTAECYLNLDQIPEAVAEITLMDVSQLDEAELTDYAFVFSAISVATGDRENLRQAEDLLKRQELAIPFFRSRRDTLLLSVMEAQRSGTSRPLLNRVRKTIAEMLARANRYILLEPNVMGFGIRGNAILSDLAGAVDQHAADGTNKKKT